MTRNRSAAIGAPRSWDRAIRCWKQKLFAPDLPRERAEFVARPQVLAAAKVFSTPLTAAAWKTKPSWGIVAESDKIINPDLERWYYKRAKSHTTEIKGASHSVYEFIREKWRR